MAERDWQKDWEMCEKATPGPWTADGRDLWHAGKGYDLGEVADWCEHCTTKMTPMTRTYLRFIAESREALPYWLRWAKEAREAIEEIIPMLLGFIEREKLRPEQIGYECAAYAMWEKLRRLVGWEFDVAHEEPDQKEESKSL